MYGIYSNLFRLALKQNRDIREELATVQSIHQFRSCVNRLKEKFQPYHMGQMVWLNEDVEPIDYNLSLPPWICQPYIRMEPEKHIKYLAEKERQAAEREKAEYFDDDGHKISRNILKRLQRASRKPNANGIRQKSNRAFEICTSLECKNPTVSQRRIFCSIQCLRSKFRHMVSTVCSSFSHLVLRV